MLGGGRGAGEKLKSWVGLAFGTVWIGWPRNGKRRKRGTGGQKADSIDEIMIIPLRIATLHRHVLPISAGRIAAPATGPDRQATASRDSSTRLLAAHSIKLRPAVGGKDRQCLQSQAPPMKVGSITFSTEIWWGRKHKHVWPSNKARAH